jgi:shikimate kinase
MSAGPVVVLIGPPGAGKSSVGPLLADRLGVTFRDTDADVEATAGKAVADIFIQDGEPAFRALERDAVATAMREHGGVLALGGGAVLDARTQQLLSGRTVAYLETGFAALSARNGMDRSRPLLIGNPRARLKALLDERLPVYERLATVTVTTDDYAPEEVAGQIAGRVAAAAGRRDGAGQQG